MDKLPTISVFPKIRSTPFLTITLPFSNTATLESVAGSSSLPTVRNFPTSTLVVNVLPVTSRTFESLLLTLNLLTSSSSFANDKLDVKMLPFTVTKSRLSKPIKNSWLSPTWKSLTGFSVLTPILSVTFMRAVLTVLETSKMTS